MLLTPHTLLGITIAAKIKNPLLSLSTAFFSHFLADASFPHWNPHIYTELKKNKKISQKSLIIILVDFFLSLLLALFFASQVLPDTKKAIIIFSGGLAAILPDSFEIPFYFFGSTNKWLLKYIHFHHRFQIDVSFFPGMAAQIALIGLCWLLISS